MNCKKLFIALCLIFSIVLGMMPVNNKNVKAENEISNNMTFESSTSFTQTMVISGDVTLTISKGVKVEAKEGIRVTPGNSLTIEGEGTLVATGQENQAGIGAGGTSYEYGDITINGGTIIANGGTSSVGRGTAGIGGINAVGKKSINNRTITINGGNVTAVGGGKDDEYTNARGAAGIGGGNGQNAGNIVINGGEINATGGSCAAAIGSGNCARRGHSTIKINGGKITSNGNIGGAVWHMSNDEESVDILITGGNTLSNCIGGGTAECDAKLTFDWTEETYNEFRIYSKFKHISSIVFNKLCIEENDLKNTPLVGADLVRYDIPTMIIPYHDIKIKIANWTVGQYDSEKNSPKVTFSPASSSTDVKGFSYEIYNGQGTKVANFTDQEVNNPGVVEALNSLPVGNYTYTVTTLVNYNHTSEEIKGSFEVENEVVTTGQPTSEEITTQATSKESKSQNPTKVIYPKKSHDFFNMLIKEAKAKKVRLKSVKAKKHRKVIARWKKLKGVSGYQLVYSKNKKFKKKSTKKKVIKSANIVKKAIKKLKAKKKYFFKIRSFEVITNPLNNKKVKVYGKWSNVKKVKAKR